MIKVNERNKLLFLGILTLILIAGCSENNKNVNGKWEVIEDKCDTYLTGINENDKVSFYGDDIVSGIEGYENYKIKESDHDDYNYLILSGEYEDTTKLRFQVTKDDLLKIMNDTNKNSHQFCHLEKKSDIGNIVLEN